MWTDNVKLHLSNFFPVGIPLNPRLAIGGGLGNLGKSDVSMMFGKLSNWFFRLGISKDCQYHLLGLQRVDFCYTGDKFTNFKHHALLSLLPDGVDSEKFAIFVLL